MRPPRAGRREVPDIEAAEEGRVGATLSVHGHRRRHTQANAIDFINYVVDKFPFRIRTIRTDRGHEFQALFHWHVADLGMEHVYIKPRTPQLNGKVERSHRTDKDEFYQLLTYRDVQRISRRNWPCGNGSTTLTDLTVRTAVKRRMKLYGRNYPSEKRPA